MHSIGNQFPAGDLAIVIESRCSVVAAAIGRDHRRFTDQQGARRRALGVVLGHQWAGYAAVLGAHARERRQYNAVRQRMGTDLDGCE
jgi:hypothetical protein